VSKLDGGLDQLDENLRALRSTQARFTAILERARVDPDNRDELIHVTGALLKGLETEISALEKTLAGLKAEK
jgi:hypothetical protein